MMIIKKKMERLFSWIAIFLPQFMKQWIYRHVMGYKIGRNVKIGLSFLGAGNMTIGDDVRIGNFNRFKGIPSVDIGSDTIISNWNHFTSNRLFYSEKGRVEKNVNPKLVIGKHVGIAIRHYFDVQDEFYIGDFTTIAGVDSQFFTHQIDITNNCQSAKPIHIGKYCMLGSGCKVSPGTIIQDYTIAAMGSVIHGDTKHKFVLIGGNPAKVIKQVDHELGYFYRLRGEVL